MKRSSVKLVLVAVALALCLPSPLFAEDAKKEESAQAKAPAEAPAPEKTAVDAETEKKKEATLRAIKAQEEASKAVREQMVKQADEYRKISARAQEAMKDIGKDLKPADAKHFYMVYQNYNLIETVRAVKSDVTDAVNKCGEVNPDMKDDLNGRFSIWDKEVGGVLDEADGNVKNMLIAQDYADPKKIRKVFDILDEARTMTRDSVHRTPVTTKESCTYLRDKMSQTRENLVRLLQTTLISFGSTYPEMPGQTMPEKDSKQDDKAAQEPAAGDVKKEEADKDNPAKEQAPAQPDAGKKD